MVRATLDTWWMGHAVWAVTLFVPAKGRGEGVGWARGWCLPSLQMSIPTKGRGEGWGSCVVLAHVTMDKKDTEPMALPLHSARCHREPSVDVFARVCACVRARVCARVFARLCVRARA